MNEVLVRWQKKNSNSFYWNELCARIVDHFGLPGGRYTTAVTEDEMRFQFKDSKDALICKLMLSEDL